jgi:alkylation response protein AidB-like acyl-CoA dehydrogenase
MQAALRDQPLVQDAVGHSEAHLRSGRAFLTETVRELWTEATSTGTLSLDQRVNLRLATTHGIRLAVGIIDTLYTAAGVTAIYQGNLIQRYFQDIHVISQHLQARLSHYELVGKHALGLKIDQVRLET